MNVEGIDWDLWAIRLDAMSTSGYISIDHFLTPETYQSIHNFFDQKQALDVFTKAAIAQSSDRQVVSEIRGDFTFWLDRQRDLELLPFFELADQWLTVFNKLCYLSLRDYEFHLAQYPEGSFYKRHLDQFKGANNRLITFILYLNDHWQEGDGGELQIYEEDDSIIKINPIGNRAIFFRSDLLPHEVLITHAPRKSITGWLLYQPKGVGQYIS